MNIDSIKNGYVIDHIEAGKGMKIYELLHLNELDCQVAIITKFSSLPPINSAIATVTSMRLKLLQENNLIKKLKFIIHLYFIF